MAGADTSRGGSEPVGPVVIGYEDSAEGRDAAALGAQLARALGVRALIAHAVALPEGVLRNGELAAALRASAASDLGEVAAAFADVEAESRAVSSTSAPRALHELAIDASASLVVVGSTDRGPIGRVLVGSTAERLLHGSPCAVAVAARGFAADDTRLLRLAVGFDESPEAAIALRAAIMLAERCNSALTLLTVADTPRFAEALGGPALPLSEYEPTEQRRMRKMLDTGLERVPPGLPARGNLMHGPAAEMLAEVSEDFDLILVGSRAYGPLRTTLLGSTSHHLLATAACSVLAMPRGMVSDPFAAAAD